MSKTTINDMTIGSPAKLIIKFMIPMCLGNLFQQFYNVVDSIVAGQFLGVQALAAIGSTGSLMFFVIGWLNGLTSGFAIMVAQSFGAKQYDRMRHYVAMSIYLSVAFALVMTIGFSVANEQILRLMNYSDEIMPSVKGYMGIIYMGLLVTVDYDALSAFLRALGDSRSPLYFLMNCTGNFRTPLFYLYMQKVPNPSIKENRFPDCIKIIRQVIRPWYPYGITIFHYCNWNNYRAGSHQYLWRKLHGRILCCRKITKYFHDCLCSLWCNNCYLCRSEPWSW